LYQFATSVFNIKRSIYSERPRGRSAIYMTHADMRLHHGADGWGTDGLGDRDAAKLKLVVISGAGANFEDCPILVETAPCDENLAGSAGTEASCGDFGGFFERKRNCDCDLLVVDCDWEIQDGLNDSM
jgi:hypothetical protein